MKINPKKIQKVSLVLTALVSFGFLAYLFLANLSFPDKNYLMEKGGKIKLYPYQPVKYKFRASDNNLSVIRLLLKNDGFVKGDKIKMELKDESCNSTIREKTLGPVWLDSKIFANFTFEKIADSQYKKYCLELIYLSERNDAKKLPHIYLSGEASFPGEIVIDEFLGAEYAGYSLVLKKAYEKENLRQNLEELSKRISQYKPFFLKKFYLAFFALAFIILSLAIVILLINL